MAKPDCTTYVADSPEEIAKEKGLSVVYPKKNQLFIDIDSREGMAVFETSMEILQDRMPGLVVHTKTLPSASGGAHFHITVTLSRPVRSEQERLLLQAVLGSDGTRGLLSYIFLSGGRARPTCFFEKKP